MTPRIFTRSPLPSHLARCATVLALAAASGSTAAAGDAVLVRDAYVVESGPKATTKYGKKGSLALKEGRSVFLAFDLGSLPQGVVASQVSHANLRLFATKVKQPGSFSLRALAAGFEESTVTGANAPPFSIQAFDPTAIPLPVTAAEQEIVVDVTAHVKAWIAGAFTNHGVTLIADAGSGLDAVFASREGEPGNKPRLEITVDPPPVEIPEPEEHTLASSSGFAPATLAATQFFAFLGDAKTDITVAAGQSVVVIASAALGTTNAAGSADAAFDVGIRLAGTTVEPVVTDEFQLLRVSQNNRIPVTATRVITGLAPGTYEVGLVYRTNSTAWNNNSTTRCIAFTIEPATP